MNSVVLIGRLTRDPELEQTTTGVSVATFRLAVGRPGGDGADFVTVKAWRRVAETSAEHLTRGRRVAVQGRFEQDEWNDREGRRVERLRVVADRVDFLDPPDSTVRPPVDDATADEHESVSSASRR
jgi:single-strand DNA-binding protein